MYDVFISWGSPDESRVKPLVDRLRDLSIVPYEYSHDMAAGSEISRSVNEAIQDSLVGVVFLSGDSAQREWITTEVAWMVHALDSGYSSLRAIIPVMVREFDPDDMPIQLRARDLSMLDATGDPGVAYTHLSSAIGEHLGAWNPIELPAALFAMTQEHFELVVDSADKRTSVFELCRALGIVEPVGILRDRYGATCEDFAPFPGGTLLESIHQAVRQVNWERASTPGQLRPIRIKWLHRTLVDPDREVRRTARREWARTTSLAIVDSLSMLHDPTADAVGKVLGTVSSRTGVLWVPPYTRRTADLRRIISEAAEPDAVGDAFVQWETRGEDAKPRPWRSFDASTDESLWNWAYRFFSAFDGGASPDLTRLRQAAAAVPAPAISPRATRARLAN